MMTTRQKKVPAQTELKNTILEGTDKIEKVAIEAKDQAVDIVVDAQEKLSQEAKQLNIGVQDQLRQLKQDLIQKLDDLKEQFGTSQKDLIDLKDFVKTEFNTVLDDLSQLTKELKEDVNHISFKHKDHLTETLKRSKEHTLEAWKKVIPNTSKESSVKSKSPKS